MGQSAIYLSSVNRRNKTFRQDLVFGVDSQECFFFNARTGSIRIRTPFVDFVYFINEREVTKKKKTGKKEEKQGNIKNYIL